ncbi:hypothetical protein JCM17844_21910 [Iodidimonas gelatinilytica]|uniref:SprA-related family protein n=1 Tax=Iodidimonas gelatinilytica TaxID=1236966 RepID=A0A5A7MSB7_9PROT|nr:putative metalloprotease CJM1_0395 family protein [Iodidimonas gelatinilytica]GEQ98554.1 hypothetical protein JCM17844_21910 [Iodidimonas gelatinilytica]
MIGISSANAGLFPPSITPATVLGQGADAPASPTLQDELRAGEPIIARAAAPSLGQNLLAGETALTAQADEDTEDTRQPSDPPALPDDLSAEEQAQVNELRARDREVRAHEAAHATAGAELAGQPQLEFETGPDGRQYAVAGEVSIDSGPIAGDPQASIDKLEKVVRAALAPAQPSSQDRAVAAQAQADLQAARAEAAALEREALQGTAPVTQPGEGLSLLV